MIRLLNNLYPEWSATASNYFVKTPGDPRNIAWMFRISKASTAVSQKRMSGALAR
ncbi:hypothetical protein IQ06DRAFT_375125 [Phaeosphaeriaceae sp. SRC1lsM3a]|nr:hypothetical protein IQ06DRAFT_375125 [Stagonospora sp. SRC1lsM3a]